MDNYQKYLDPQTLAKLKGLELQARLIVEGYVPGCTAARTTASRSSSPSTASTSPATTCATSIGRSSARPTGSTSSSTRKRRTSSATCCSTPARACATSRDAGGRLEARIRPVRRGRPRLPGPAAAGQRRPGDVRHDSAHFVRASSHPSHLKQLLHVMEQTTAGGKTATGPDLSRPGRAHSQARAS